MKIIYKQKIGFLALIVVALQLAACQKNTSSYVEIHPAHIEHVEGSDFSKVELTEEAFKRIGILTTDIAEETVAQGQGAPQLKKVIPYSAVIYSPHGETWVYTNPEPRVFIRDVVEVEYVEKGKAILSKAPAVGTKIVVQGVAELYGTEYEVGH